MKRKNVGYQDRKRNGFSWSHILFLAFFCSHSTNIFGFRIHNAANPARKAKIIVETMMFRKIIQHSPLALQQVHF